jgi:hypothetical protein
MRYSAIKSTEKHFKTQLTFRYGYCMFILTVLKSYNQRTNTTSTEITASIMQAFIGNDVGHVYCRTMSEWELLFRELYFA